MLFRSHKLDLTKNFHLNSSLSLDGWLVEGSVGLDIVDNQSSSQNTITFAYECTRNFGDRLYNVTGLAPGFASFVNTLSQTATGAELHRRVTDVVGTHFVSGYQSEARVVVLYTFEFASRTRVSNSTPACTPATTWWTSTAPCKVSSHRPTPV